MGSGRRYAVSGKLAGQPAIFRICRAERAETGKVERPVRVFPNLQVTGEKEEGLAQLASLQCGMVQRRQLDALGISRGSVASRVVGGRLYRRFPGVFSVGYPRDDWQARLAGALLYLRQDSVISHRAAAGLWGLIPEPELVQVTVIGRHVGSRPGLRLHRVAGLDIRDVRILDGLPVTSPARTLIDFASEADEAQLLRAVAEGRVAGLINDADLTAAIARCPRRPGTGRLNLVRRQEVGRAPTRSDAERLLLSVVRKAELPEPMVNVRLLGFEVDFLWREARLVIEMDGYAAHGHRGAFEKDRRRDQVLIAAGYRVIRVTWRQLCEEPVAVVARIAQALVVRYAHANPAH
jgi:very-short-patch-repair endonuclease